jgi:CcmD family protein
LSVEWLCATEHSRNLRKEKTIYSMKKIITLLCIILNSVQTFSQESNSVEMATGLRSSGKIYVVIAVISVIFIGLAAYLFTIDKRLKKIERENKL